MGPAFIPETTKNRVTLGSERRRVLGSAESGISPRRNRGERPSVQDPRVADPVVVRPVPRYLTNVASCYNMTPMSVTAPSVRSIAFGLLVAALVLGRLALDLHPYEHPLDADDEIGVCHACAAGESPPLQAGAHSLSAPSPASTHRGPRERIGAVPLRTWTRPPYRGPPPLV